MHNILKVIISLLIFSLNVQLVSANGYVSVQLYDYYNSESEDYSGSCCDAVRFFGSCLNDCDNSFEIWLTSYPAAWSGPTWKYWQTYVLGDDNFDFPGYGRLIGSGIRNPLTYKFSGRWPRSFGIRLKVWDDDSGNFLGIGSKSDVVDYALKSIVNVDAKKSTSPPVTHSLSGRRSTTRVLVRVYCDTNYYGRDCGVFCIPRDDNTNGHYTCDQNNGNKICRRGWMGHNCLTDTTLPPPLPCDSSPCLNNATCINLEGNHTCNCTDSYTERNCHIYTTPPPPLPCDSSPCLHNATCIDLEGNYTCNCTHSYTGRNCHIYTTPPPPLPCDSSPCTNNGICLPIGSSYYCVCSSSFTGSNCETEVNECISRACKNGGTCIDEKIGYTCQCHRGFFGSSCQHIDPCFFKPCQNNGRCERNVTTPNDYTCVCLSGYTGNRCEQDNSFFNTMYPFGPNENDLLMPEGRLYSFMCFGLGIPGPGLEFFGKRHASFSICRNGMILFDENYSRTWPRRFGLRYWDRYLAALAPYWSIIDDDRLFDSNTVFTFEGSLFDEIRSNRKRRSSHSRKTYRMRIDPKRQSKVYYHLYSRWNNNSATAAMLTKASKDVKKYSGNSVFNDFKASFVAVITWVNLYPARIRTFPYFSLSNTFQAVIITDGVYTFLMYNYPSGGIQWAVPVDRSEVSWVNRWYRSPGLPVAGWNSGNYERNRFFNIRQSSSLAIAQLSRSPGNTQETGRWFFRIDESSSRREAEKMCYTWYQQQPRLVVPPLRPCACSMFQAFRDRRFQFDWRYHREFPVSSRGFCFLRRRFFRPIYLYYIINDETNLFQIAYGRWSQRCCYSNDIFDYGSLLIGPQNGGHAQLELYDRFYRPIGVVLSDEEAYRACCVDSELCHLFYERRPSDTCWRYRPPRIRWFWGDPHIVTLDNKNYTFNGLGEYIMADIQNGFFQLQARTAKATGQGIATVFSAAVAREQNTSKIEARLSSSQSGLDVLVDGSPFNYSSITNGSKEIGNITITRDENSGVSATFPSGISVTFSEVKGMMTIVIAAPDSFKNKTRGLLGVWNDDPSDDFTLPDGTVIPASSSDRVIHNEFGLKWQITAEQSLFTYKSGQVVDTFKNLSYTPLFADELNFTDPVLEAKARETCGSDLACLFDIAATKDVSVGQATLTTSQKLVNESNQLENFPPTLVNASSIIELTLNKRKEFELVANDTNGDQIVFLPPSLPGLQTFRSGNTLTMNWTLSSTNKVNFTVVVRDSKGASVIWSPTILVCACQNGGNCSRPDNLNGDKFQVMSCKCASGYSGRLCDSNLNACDFNSGPCFYGVNCTDLPPPSGVNGYECGLCPAGYSGNGANCTDIDECLDSGRCSQLCVNTPGSYFCQCNAGYNLNSDGKTCDDVDECQRPGTCMHKCTNTAGSYACTCNQAFKKDPNDPSRCVPTSPCSAGDNGCQQVCYVENNQKKCSCHKGYELQPDQKICKDVDECLVKPCTQLCRNTEGGYTCYCKQRFKLKADNFTCEDINECAEGNYTCSDPFHQCINFEGGYKCECEQGSYWYNGSCHDVGKNTTYRDSDPPTPREASTEEEDEAVEIRVKNMPKNKWKATRDKIFKTTVASLVSAYCSTNREECGLPPKRRHAIDENLYTENQVHLLPGYPKQDGADLIVVFYVQTPPGIVSAAVAVPAKVVVEILKNNRQKVEESLESRAVSYIKPYKSKPDVPDTSDRTLIWIVIGVFCAVLVFLVFLLIVMIFCMRREKKRIKSKKRSYLPNSHPYGVTNGGWSEDLELDDVESKNSIEEHEANTTRL